MTQLPSVSELIINKDRGNAVHTIPQVNTPSSVNFKTALSIPSISPGSSIVLPPLKEGNDFHYSTDKRLSISSSTQLQRRSSNSELEALNSKPRVNSLPNANFQRLSNQGGINGSFSAPSAAMIPSPNASAGTGAPSSYGQEVMVPYPVDYFHYNYPPYYPYYMGYSRSPSQVSPLSPQQPPPSVGGSHPGLPPGPVPVPLTQLSSPNLKMHHAPLALPLGSISGGALGPTPQTVSLDANNQTHVPSMTHLQAPMQMRGSIPPNMGIPLYKPYEENHVLINRRRIIKRRTRTGCMTCRKRRIKCDERKPHCFNCERSRKVCLGYENVKKKD